MSFLENQDIVIKKTTDGWRIEGRIAKFSPSEVMTLLRALSNLNEQIWEAIEEEEEKLKEKQN